MQLDNVIVAPHALAWTDERFLGNGRAACQSILDVAEGRVLRSVVNRQVLDEPALEASSVDAGVGKVRPMRRVAAPGR